jgi:hypothetical protein
VEQVAQVGAGLGLGRVGPQRESQRRAVERLAPGQHQAGEQLAQARRVEARELSAVGDDGHAAQQADGQAGTYVGGRHGQGQPNWTKRLAHRARRAPDNRWWLSPWAGGAR